jgi:hypothetical protein
MKKIFLFDVNYHLKIMTYGNQELNHQVIGMHHYQIGQNNERNRLENINKKKQNKFNLLFNCFCFKKHDKFRCMITELFICIQTIVSYMIED